MRFTGCQVCDCILRIYIVILCIQRFFTAQGGGLFLALLTEEYFSIPQCVEELLAFLKLHDLKDEQVLKRGVMNFLFEKRMSLI